MTLFETGLQPDRRDLNVHNIFLVFISLCRRLAAALVNSLMDRGRIIVDDHNVLNADQGLQWGSMTVNKYIKYNKK